MRGDLFSAADPGLQELILHGHRLCDAYNAPETHDERPEIIQVLFGKTGKDPYVEAPIHVDYGFNITVGDNFYCNFDCVFLDGAPISFGDNCFLAPGVQVLTATHPVDAVQRRTVEYAKPIVVGDDVWMGAGVLVLAGVTIGSRVVIAAGAVVNKDVPSDVVVGGVPAKILKRLVPRPAVRAEKEEGDDW